MHIKPSLMQLSWPGNCQSTRYGLHIIVDDQGLRGCSVVSSKTKRPPSAEKSECAALRTPYIDDVLQNAS